MFAFIRKHIVVITLVVILVGAFVLRFAALDHPLTTNGSEGFRDLLVAKHALEYGEWPIGGHANGLSTIENSPLYYYLVILLALPGATFMSVGFMYVLFQCAFVLLVFLFVRSVFNEPAALVASFLMAVSPHYVMNVTGFFIWPPYFAAPFVILSLWALWCGYRDRKKTMIGASPLLMLAALAIHQSTIAIIPLYAVLVLYAAYKRSFSLKHYLVSGLAFLALATALFAPPILVSDLDSFSWGTRLTNDREVSSMLGVHQTAVSIPYAFGVYSGDPPKLRTELVFVFLLILALWFFQSKDHLKDRRHVALLILFLMSEVAVAILFDPEGIPRHFEPVWWIVPVVVGVLVTTPLKRSLFVSLVAVVTFMLMTYSAATDDRLLQTYPNIGSFNRPRYEVMERVADSILEEVERIRLEGRYTDYTFFNMYVTLLGTDDFSSSPLVLWLPLEERLDIKLDESPNSHFNKTRVTHLDDYVFYACFSRRSDSTIEECMEEHTQANTEHVIQKTVFESEGAVDVAVYLAKRKENVTQ